MKLPKGWNDITVEQFIELSTFKLEDYDTEIDFQIQMYSCLTDEDPILFEYMEADDFNKLANEFNWMKTLPSTKPKQSIIIEQTELHLINLNNITNGEFVDAETLINENKISNLNLFLSIMYRRMLLNNDDTFTPDVIEPYGNYIHHRAKLFDDVAISDVYGILQKYLDFRTLIFDNYEFVFTGTDGDEDITDEEKTNMTRAERLEYKKAEEEEKASRKWGMMPLLMKLADYDLTKLEAIEKQSLIVSLNVLAMIKELKVVRE